MRIGVLDDDAAQLEAVARVCEGIGHTVFKAKSVAALKAQLSRDTFDLLILDWMLPESSGIEMLDWVRTNIDPSPPMLMVTSRDDHDDVARALHAGADDYIAKPIVDVVLAARIAALLRRAYPNKPRDGEERHGPFVFRPSSKTVLRGDDEIALSEKEFALAVVLFRNLNRALSRDYILDAVPGWNPSLSSRTLDIHISKIRAKLTLRASAGFRISSVYGFGYRLEDVDTVEQQPMSR